MLRRLRTYFLTGLVVGAPIAITIYLTWQFIGAVDGMVESLLPKNLEPDSWLPVTIPGIGVLVVIVFLTLLGFLTANFFGRAILHVGESILDKMPIVRSIYSTLKQIFQTIVNQSSKSFKEVVLVEYPRKGIWAIAFVTADTHETIQKDTAEDMVTVFMPTTPNPTSGFLLFFPKQDVIHLDMSVEQGVKYVISAGLVPPSESSAPGK